MAGRTRQTREQREEWLTCAASFGYWCDRYAQVYDASARSWLPFHLWPAQRATAETLAREHLVVILKARQLGMTWLVVGYALWLLLFRPAATVLLFSKRDDEAVHLLNFRLCGMYERLPAWMQARSLVANNDHELRLSNGSAALAFPTTGGRSYTATLAGVIPWHNSQRDLRFPFREQLTDVSILRRHSCGCENEQILVQIVQVRLDDAHDVDFSLCVSAPAGPVQAVDALHQAAGVKKCETSRVMKPLRPDILVYEFVVLELRPIVHLPPGPGNRIAAALHPRGDRPAAVFDPGIVVEIHVVPCRVYADQNGITDLPVIVHEIDASLIVGDQCVDLSDHLHGKFSRLAHVSDVEQELVHLGPW